MKPGDIIKIKLGGDVHEAKVLDCRNKKTIWVEVLWAKTRIHALTPAEKKKVAESPISLEGLSENEKALALLAQAGKKVVHQSGSKRIKIPRAKVIGADSFQPQVSKSVLKRQAIQEAAKPLEQPEPGEIIFTVDDLEETESTQAPAFGDENPEELPEPQQPPQLSAKDRLKAKLAAKKAE